MNTRREFLVCCSAGLAAFGLMPLRSLSRPVVADSRTPAVHRLSYELLANQVNTTFRVRRSPGQAVELRLVKAPLAPPVRVVPGRRPPADAGNERFSLIFSGPKDGLLAPAIHRFEHRQLGSFEMYIGRIGTLDPDSVRYEAVFNQPVTDGVHATPS